MTTVALQTVVTINLEAGCDYASCAELAHPLHKQLSGGGYTWPCSVMPLPESIEEWDGAHRTARKRAGRAESDGYTFAHINREEHEDDVFEINGSAESRQGRQMSEGYRVRPTFSPLPEYLCSRHAIRTYGVLDPDGKLRAYTWVYRVGSLVMFSTILGHAQHLERGIMYALVRGALADQIQAGPGFAFYGMHNSGGAGLTWMKERCGFAPTRVMWELA